MLESRIEDRHNARRGCKNQEERCAQEAQRRPLHEHQPVSPKSAAIASAGATISPNDFGGMRS